MPALETEATDPAQVVEVQLIRFFQELALSEEFIKDPAFRVWLDPRRDDVMVTFWRKIPAICSPDVRLPLTWWDHFKDRFFRGYMRTRFPARYRIYQARMYLPELPLPDYKGARVCVFAELERCSQ